MSDTQTRQGRPRVGIIGTGFGGIGMAIQLERAGIADVILWEKADDVGGVWRDNSYPGAACDVPSHLYSFSFAPKADWSRRFAGQTEIRAYLHEVAERFGVLDRVRFGTEVRAASFDERSGTWTVEIAGQQPVEVEVLITAMGQLSRPAIPDLAGLADFGGEVFHSATWNHDYDLADKRVAVIGTGASAIQFVPQIQPQVAALSLFQRDAAHVLAKPDYRYPPVVNKAFNAVPGLQTASRWLTYWQLEPRAALFTQFPALMSIVRWRFNRHLSSQVGDPQLRQVLTPTDPIGCKRILLSNDYYPALSQPNVDVVTSSIASVDASGIRTADGRHHEVDAIILGTGFTATSFLAPLKITGRDGQDLQDRWADGAEAHLGITVAGFPNLFMLYGPNTNLSHSSIVYMLESQIRYVVGAVRGLVERDLAWMDVRAKVQQRFNERLQKRIKASVWAAGCRSWYQTAEGKNTTNWPGFTFAYRRRTRRPDLSDYELQSRTPAAADASPRQPEAIASR